LLILAAGTIAGYAADKKVIAYYFHGNARCPTCHKMEKYTKEAIESGFSNELKSGALAFMRVNVEEEGNEHFIAEYQLYTKALVISQIEDDKEVRHKDLSKIWEYVRDKERFLEYVTGEINGYLKE
jgi:hypothetical protein